LSLALYRKYRSRDFSAVLGQPHVVNTLTAALANGHTSHAYLFTGPRGVGKTTVARLLAKGLNCTAAKAKPCGSCNLCSLDTSANMDVIEIDAASNRRIDEIRELRDKIGLAPSQGRYKIYIIDEVHMLTTEAFNALLKTLEEPPAHAVFILATTEAHKLPETIVSRTQRFHFKPITESELIRGLSSIAAAEKLQLDPAAAELLAQAGRGGFRDAISLLDQIAATGANPIDASTVRRVLGWSDQELIDRLSLGIAQCRPAAALKAFDEALNQGLQATQLISQLISRWREFLLSSVTSSSIDKTAAAITEAQGPAGIAAIIDSLILASKSSWPDLSLETLIVKHASPVIRPTASTVQAAPSVATAAEPIASPKPPVVPTSQDDPDLWLKALMMVKQVNNSLYALLRSCGSTINGNELVVTCRFNFHKERLQEPKNRQLLEAALARVYGRQIRMAVQLENAGPTPATADSETELVSSALEILGGEVINE
jgi:DNA polymerase III subunit gamma/tau